ncbi:MAG: murein hydrolase activator EnvC family protein [Flavobacteriales bacterium]|jgi:septal ring factor EnvC (AmiA/AmiB activator)|tara:strand:+ start:21538 stop:22755 length:1218 start_codon:yes stop_codon:yes gene_type:complete
MHKTFCFIVLFWIGMYPLLAQNTSKRQQELESQRIRLKNEIKQINQLLFTNTKTRKNALNQAEDIQVKLNVRNELIKVTNEQVNILTRRINLNQRNIGIQRKELELLKEDYASMIQKSYASKSLKNRLMFLFSSKNFFQAYKRIQYLKQYASYRRKQGLAIEKKTLLLQQLNQTLINEKTKKGLLIDENRDVKGKLANDRKDQEILIKRLKRKERNLITQILKKQKQTKEIDQEISRLIREAIEASNKALGKKGNKSFELTPEAKLIAANFSANKGRLPWPLEKGVVIQRFGRQPHPVVKTTIIQSNGVTFATEPKAQVRTIFKGEVMSVVLIKGSNPSVLIRHGNYISVYKNLGKLYVKKGDKVKAKEIIGEVFTNKKTGKTELQFSIFNNVKVLNPKGWIYQM